MGQTQAKQFQPPQAIGSVNRPNDILSQSMAAPTLPQNALQPLIQNQIPFVQTANAVPTQATPQQNNVLFRKYDNGFDPFQQNYRMY